MTDARSALVLVLALLATALAVSAPVSAFHRIDTETELTTVEEGLAVSEANATSETSLKLVYEYPTYAPAALRVETTLEVEPVEAPLAVDVEPSNVSQASANHPHQRDPTDGQRQRQREEATIQLSVDASEVNASGSAELIVHANTSGTLTLKDSRDAATVTVAWTDPNASEPESAEESKRPSQDAEPEQAPSDDPPEVQNDEPNASETDAGESGSADASQQPVPGPGLGLLAACLAGSARRLSASRAPRTLKNR